MTPEDTERHDFFLALRAAEHRALLEDTNSLPNLALPDPIDGLAEISANVTATLRAANESAEQITTQLHQQAVELMVRARDEAEQLRQEAERVRQEAEQEASRIRAEAGQTLDRARDQAALIVSDAEARVAKIEAAAEQRGRNRALAMLESHVGRLADAARSHSELRARLSEASDELQLVLLALGEPIADAEGALRDSVFEV